MVVQHSTAKTVVPYSTDASYSTKAPCSTDGRYSTDVPYSTFGVRPPHGSSDVLPANCFDQDRARFLHNPDQRVRNLNDVRICEACNVWTTPFWLVFLVFGFC